jgi:hypothetical protein
MQSIVYTHTHTQRGLTTVTVTTHYQRTHMRNFFLGFLLAWAMIITTLMMTSIPEYTVITKTVCI